VSTNTGGKLLATFQRFMDVSERMRTSANGGLAEVAVQIEPVSNLNSLITGKLTGNFRKCGA
jgi:hypothetical protein